MMMLNSENDRYGENQHEDDDVLYAAEQNSQHEQHPFYRTATFQQQQEQEESLYFQHRPYREQQQQQQQGFFGGMQDDNNDDRLYPFESSPQPNRPGWFENRLTGSNFGIFAAIFAILYFQFQEPILRWFQFYFRRDVSVTESVIVLFWQSLDFLRACWQIFVEALRSIWDWLSLFVMSFVIGGDAAADRAVADVLRRNRRRRRILRRGVLFGDGTGSENLPELEQIQIDCGENNIYQNNNSQRESSEPRPAVIPILSSGASDEKDTLQTNSCNEFLSSQRVYEQPSPALEPAFLDENDYPPGWMVYHPALGVVAKTEADRYEQQQLFRLNDAPPKTKRKPALSEVENQKHDAPATSKKVPNGVKNVANGNDDCSSSRRSSTNLLDTSTPQQTSDIPLLRSIAAT